MFEPLLQGKFGRHAAEVNMAWFWARFKARSTRLATYQGGFQAFADDAAANLRQREIRILLNTPVRQIVPHVNNSVALELDSGQEVYDRCLVTVSPALDGASGASLTLQLPAGPARPEKYGRGGHGPFAEKPIVRRRLLLV